MIAMFRKKNKQPNGCLRVGTQDGYVTLLSQLDEGFRVRSMLTPEAAKTLAADLEKAADRLMLRASKG